MKTIKLHSCNIILSDHWVGLKSPLEWSMTNHIMLDSGLSTVWTGGLYIPGKSSIPNESENHPATILVFTCSLRNSCSFLVFSRCHNLCHSFGYPLFIVSANGQKPLQSLMRTESTKGQFWWWVSSLSNMHLGLLLLYWRHVRPQEI